MNATDSQSEDVAQSWQKTAVTCNRATLKERRRIEEEVEVDLSASSDDDRCYDRADPDELHRTELRRNFLLLCRRRQGATVEWGTTVTVRPYPAPTKVAHPARARPSKAHGKDKKAAPREGQQLQKTAAKDGRVPWWSVLPGFACPRAALKRTMTTQSVVGRTGGRGGTSNSGKASQATSSRSGNSCSRRGCPWMRTIVETARWLRVSACKEPQDQAQHHPDDRANASASIIIILHGVKASMMPPPHHRCRHLHR